MINELSRTEKLVLYKIKQNDSNILMIPINVFVSILLYLELEEDFETCAKVMKFIDKVKINHQL